ncbi:hypothetical protein HGRIS_012752 [Hohenbuehelia grisea]|uniref:Neuroguidin n=1 Tax=Hohenbuehelia grisea TaxID=104357 RepID=A0ABR3ITC4_9AGAR
MEAQINTQEFCDAVDDMSGSFASVRELLKSFRDPQTHELDMKDGISLLGLKHHVVLSYLQSLLLVASRAALGHSLAERAPPKQAFSDHSREARGSGSGDLVDSMIENRLVLEKIKVLESRMRYQIDKLVRLAEENTDAKDVANDPLAFRPNPQNLVNDDDGPSDDDRDKERDASKSDGIYHPPRMAPMPYTEPRKDKKARRGPVPSALASLVNADPLRPHIESTSGLGSMPSLTSARAREIQRINEFEEENFTRIMMKKKDAKRRLRDEEDIALGGSASIGGGTGKTRRRAGGLEDEFHDVLRSVDRSSRTGASDGYDELRQKGRKGDVLERSRSRRVRDEAFADDDDTGGDGGRKKKRTRFELDMKSTKKKIARARK